MVLNHFFIDSIEINPEGITEYHVSHLCHLWSQMITQYCQGSVWDGKTYLLKMVISQSLGTLLQWAASVGRAKSVASAGPWGLMTPPNGPLPVALCSLVMQPGSSGWYQQLWLALGMENKVYKQWLTLRVDSLLHFFYCKGPPVGDTTTFLNSHWKTEKVEVDLCVIRSRRITNQDDRTPQVFPSFFRSSFWA